MQQELAVYTLGFLQVPYIRRMLAIAGWKVRFGPFCRSAVAVGVWGRKPLARRGFKAAHRRSLPVVSVEDAFLRSISPGPTSVPAGLIIDEVGIYFDANHPSKLENILNSDSLDDAPLMERAINGIAFLRSSGLSKYNPVARRETAVPAEKYVLVVDQTAGDASLRYGNAGENTFVDMLAAAKSENPGIQVLVRTHPAVLMGNKSGHYTQADCDDQTSLMVDQTNPWDLLEGASKVYCATSQLGFEAILAGHKPVVFGMPFYAGWGLSDDRQTCARRTKKLSVPQLFAGVMLRYPVWIDSATNTVCSFEEAAQSLQAKARNAWASRQPSVVLGMSNWKIPQISRFLGSQSAKPWFVKKVGQAVNKCTESGARAVIWASKETPEIRLAFDAAKIPLWLMEDGFLRSNGLGAELTPADSIVLDDIGIYFDATRPSRLENLIADSVDLPVYASQRASKLRKLICDTGITKYNLEGEMVSLPDTDKLKILVPGQVEDDASIRLGATTISTNLSLLRVTRQANPGAYIIYKPHPDVEAGLRVGKVESAEQYADIVIENGYVPALLEQVDAVWTMTSLLGFEALLRGVKTTCLGMPFYAGWGLTDDQGQQCVRRTKRPTLNGLIHACLVDYPLYLDPVDKQATTPEKLIRRLKCCENTRSPKLVLLAKLQGRFARFAHLWR